MRKLIAVSLMLAAGCAPTVSSPSAPPPLRSSPVSSVSPTDMPKPSTAAVDPCHDQQMVLTPGHSGVAAGTAYLRVFVELAQGPPCTLPRSPMITLMTEDGAEIARATETDATPLVLDYITGYRIGWNVPCDAAPTGTVNAHIEFSRGLIVDLPLGIFGPSCVDGSSGSLTMIADDRE
jgi:hypothetical protein